MCILMNVALSFETVIWSCQSVVGCHTIILIISKFCLTSLSLSQRERRQQYVSPITAKDKLSKAEHREFKQPAAASAVTVCSSVATVVRSLVSTGARQHSLLYQCFVSTGWQSSTRRRISMMASVREWQQCCESGACLGWWKCAYCYCMLFLEKINVPCSPDLSKAV